MGWFEKKPAWEQLYAERLYDALVVDDNLGEITPAKLRVPLASFRRYHEKALLHRELLSFTALMTAANPTTAPNLGPVIEHYKLPARAALN